MLVQPVHCAVGYIVNQLHEVESRPYTATIKINGSLASLVWLKKGSPYSITERRVPELIPVLGS